MSKIDAVYREIEANELNFNLATRKRVTDTSMASPVKVVTHSISCVQ